MRETEFHGCWTRRYSRLSKSLIQRLCQMGFWYRQERWAVSHKRINKKSINTYLLYMLSPAFSRGPRISAKAWLWGIKVNLYFLFRALQLVFAARAREGRGTFLSPRTLLAVSFAWIPPPPLDPPPRPPIEHLPRKLHHNAFPRQWEWRNIHSPLKKWEENWSRNASRKCFRDRYWGRAGQLLANKANVLSVMICSHRP